MSVCRSCLKTYNNYVNISKLLKILFKACTLLEMPFNFEPFINIRRIKLWWNMSGNIFFQQITLPRAVYLLKFILKLRFHSGSGLWHLNFFHPPFFLHILLPITLTKTVILFIFCKNAFFWSNFLIFHKNW